MKTGKYSHIKLLTGIDYLKEEFPQIQFLVGDWLPRCGSLLLGGSPKTGKSWFVYYLADAIARGSSFLKWNCTHGQSIIIDCDNRPQTIQNRLALMANSQGDGDEGNPDIRIITRETFTDNGIQFPNFRDHSHLVAVFDLIGQGDIVFLDNVNLAFPGGNENDTTFWNDIENFVLEGRKRGMAVVVVHHTKKNDRYELSGSNKMNRVFEGGVVLGKIGEDIGKDAYFNVVFKFMREQSDQTDNFSARLTTTNAIQSWAVGAYIEPTLLTSFDGDSRRTQAIQLKQGGSSVRDIASTLGVPRGTVGHWVNGVLPLMEEEDNEEF